nr:UDP-glycosyltransferase 73E1-like [Ipomoea trifida]
MMAMTANQSRQQLHFIVFPMMLPGHMIPLIDVARMLARCDGVIVTVLTTPLNAKRFRPALNRERQCGFQIREHELRFPCAEAGLPEGCENGDLIPKGQNHLAANFIVAVGMLRPQVEEALKQSKPPASCIVSDVCLTWTAEVAAGLNIPRLMFKGSCCFSDICATRITESMILGKVGSESEQFTVPEVPHNIQLCKAQVKLCTTDLTLSDDDPSKQLGEKLMEASKSAYGVIVNSFEEMEPDYVKENRKMHHGRVWCVGPVSLCDQIYQDQLLRGNNNNYNDQQECLKWLDLQAPGSVVYVSFGSMASLSPRQMAELALGLESNKRPFLWVLGKKGKNVDAFEDWNVSNGFEQRNRGRGLLVRGWAPQVLILSHTSVGGFLTHCGWNSTLEAISAKVPMVTWPLIAEQFLNEKLVVEVLGIGVSLGLKMYVDWDGEDKNDVVVVKNEEIKEAIDKIMDEGGIEIRKKVRELGEMAKKAVQKGGSSQLNLISLVQNISSFAQP